MPATAADLAIRLVSALPQRHQSALEQLLFFNPGQEGATADIEESIARHGVPEIVVEGELLGVRVAAFGTVQTLYAVAELDGREELAGVVLYFRPAAETLLVLHIAVDHRFAATGGHADAMVVMRLFEAVRQVARRLKGVRHLTLYANGTALGLPV
jgi:hypothetical protein